MYLCISDRHIQFIVMFSFQTVLHDAMNRREVWLTRTRHSVKRKLASGLPALFGGLRSVRR